MFLSDFMTKQFELFENLMNKRFETLTESLNKASQPNSEWPPISLNAISSSLTRVVFQQDSIRDKSTRAVLVGHPEDQDEEVTKRNDLLLIQNLLAKIDHPSLNMDSITYHRHPAERKSVSHNRIIKIQLKDHAARDLFLSMARRVRGASLTGNPHAYFRRDFTSEELALDRELRQQAGRKNCEANSLIYIVRDLKIVKLSVPRVLPKRSAENRLKYISQDNTSQMNYNLNLPSQFAQSSDRSRPSTRGKRGSRGHSASVRGRAISIGPSSLRSGVSQSKEPIKRPGGDVDVDMRFDSTSAKLFRGGSPGASENPPHPSSPMA